MLWFHGLSAFGFTLSSRASEVRPVRAQGKMFFATRDLSSFFASRHVSLHFHPSRQPLFHGVIPKRAVLSESRDLSSCAASAEDFNFGFRFFSCHCLSSQKHGRFGANSRTKTSWQKQAILCWQSRTSAQIRANF
jgi:hypothetical protein